MNYRRIWERANGPIPKDEEGRSYHIHHIDGNRNNNALENLVCVSVQEHYDIHYRQGDFDACHALSTLMGRSLTGWTHTEKTRQKLREVNRGNRNAAGPRSEETKERLRQIHSTRPRSPHSESTKQKIRESLKGRPSTRKSFKHSEETKILISALHKGRKLHPDVIARRQATRSLNAQIKNRLTMEEMKPIHKYNSGRGATLCHKCSKIISEGMTEHLYCEECSGVPTHNYKLVRQGDGLTVVGNKVLWLEWNENGTFKKDHTTPLEGASLIVDPHLGNYTWMTTTVKSFTEEGNEITFKTKNSDYKLIKQK